MLTNITEVWKPIDGYENKYFISNCGNVKHIKYGLKSLQADRGGYLRVGLWKNKTKKFISVHRLVANAFLPNPDNKPEVNHIDFNRANNDVRNLEWVTTKENNIHSLSNRPKEYRLYKDSTTKEKYISYNKKRKTYQVLIKDNYHGVYKTLDDAIKVRNEKLNEYEKHTSK